MDKALFLAMLLALTLGETTQAGPLPAAVIRVDFKFDNKVNHTRDLPSMSLQSARKRMVGSGKVSLNELRALADAGDGLAAFRYAKALQEATPPAKAGAAAHYYAISAYTGRSFAVRPLGRLLLSEGAGYSPSLLKQSLNALTIQAISGDADAAQLLGKMYSDGLPFGRDLGQAQHFLALAGQSDPGAALKLGIALMSDPADAALDHVGARAALGLAADGPNLSARVTAENLLRLLDGPAPAAVVASGPEIVSEAPPPVPLLDDAATSAPPERPAVPALPSVTKAAP